MAETERTFVELQTLLSDNDSEDLSEQDLRDFMVSALGGYGGISVDGGAAAQAHTAAALALDAFDTVGPARGATPSLGPDQILIGVAGDYMVTFSASLTASVPTVLELELFVGAVKQPGLSITVDASSASVDVSRSVPLTLAAGAVLDMRASAVPNASVTIRHANFAVKRVG